MKEISFDKAKLPKAMELIQKAAAWMEEKDCDHDIEAGQVLETLQKELRILSGNEELQIKNFQDYWAYTDLETVAQEALMSPPSKCNVTDEQIREIVIQILDYEEAERDWWLKYLEINTNLENLTDYIFYPDSVGLDLQATLEQIAEKIITDRK